MIVTISREYGAAGLAVADGVARRAGYALLTDDLPAAVAARLGTSPDEVAARATAGGSLTERILAGLGASTPEVASPAPAGRMTPDFDESVRREIERTIRDRAAAGDLVVLGRNAGAVLADRSDVLRVFLTASREWRIARIVSSFGQRPADAAADLDRIDAWRRKIAKERYGLRWGDARSYDLCVDVQRATISGAVAVASLALAERLARDVPG